jgi:hypothetical protein
MPVMRQLKAKKVATAHVKKGRVALKRAMKKLVVARVLAKRGKTARAAKVRKVGQRALTKAVGHLSTAVHTKAKVRSRVKALRRRRGGGGGGGGSSILNTIGSIAGTVLGFL